jgi:hypothetical protein
MTDTTVTAKPAPAQGIGSTTVSTGYLDPTELSKWLVGLLAASIVLNVIAVGSGVAEYSLLTRIQAGDIPDDSLRTSLAQASDTCQQLIGIAQIILFAVTSIVFARWIMWANYNVRQLGAKDLQFTPGWAVGWYFIPIANLFKPYQAMAEIWCAAQSPESWPTIARGALLRSWWALILIDGLVTNAATRIALSANTIEQIIFGSGLMIFSDAISTATCWVALQLVRQITAFQSQSFRRLTGAVTPEAAA